MKISETLMEEIVKKVLLILESQGTPLNKKTESVKPTWYMPPTEGQCELMQSFRDQMKAFYSPVTDPKSAEILCIGTTSAKALAEIGRGYGDTETAQLVLEHLALGKEVHILEEGIIYRRYEQTCAPKLYAKWLSYEDGVRELGVQFVNRNTGFPLVDSAVTGQVPAVAKPGASDISAEKVQGASEQKERKSVKLSDRVITERMLMQMRPSAGLQIDIENNAKVTPLANDYIRAERLKINRLEKE